MSKAQTILPVDLAFSDTLELHCLYGILLHRAVALCRLSSLIAPGPAG